MTTKIFWQDPYLTELDTAVKTVNHNQITLVETILYAFSGGQESDSGTIGGYPVLQATKQGLEIFYTLSDNHALKAEDKVKVKIDWDRRYKLMRHHFAAEIILELIYQKYSNIPKIGAHIAQNKARIDFKWDKNISAILAELQNAAQSIIDAKEPIICAFSDEATERRYWKINGFSSVPCGGTHVKHTGEIGKIRLKRVNPGKGIERIEIFAEDNV